MLPDSDDGFVSKFSHPLCNRCKAIFATIPFNIPGQYEGEHHLTVRDLEESAGNRCQLCIIALNRVTQETLEAWRCSDLESPTHIRWSVAFSQEWLDFFSIRLKKSDFLDVNLPFEEVEEGTKVAPPAIRTSCSTGSQETLNCARGWLTECTITHEQCRTLTSKGWLPTRLIYAGNSADAASARLCLRAEVPAESAYITLSHCWGSPAEDQLKLLQHNIQALRRQIPLDVLPKTWIDAISVTRAMGCEYLWIDSLCIIQDSVDDWRAECSTMGLVYKNGWCSIAASAAKNGSEGCFMRRHPTCFQPLIVEADSVEMGAAYSCSARRFHVNRLAQDVESPLYQRGWVIQEWFLAPRILFFARQMIHWECASGAASEAHPAVNKSKSVLSFVTKLRARYERAPMSLERCLDEWQKLVQVYMSTRLTMVRDKLPAFSGIAREFYDQLVAVSPSPCPRYLAGLWTPLLAVQLLWKVDYGSPKDQLQPYRAPSWSWASVDTPISSPIDRISSRMSKHTIINILHSEVSAVGDDPFQEVSSGFIRLEGWLWKISKGASLEQVGESPRLNLQLAFDDDGAKATKRTLSEEVFLLPVIVDPDDAYMALYVWGILLNKYGETPGQFRRVGFLGLNDGGSKRVKTRERQFHPTFEPVLELYGRSFPCIEVAGGDQDCITSRRDKRFPSNDTFRLGSHLCIIEIF
ncbi:HET-domain-containing protein [Pleurotus pulmonarius]